MHLQCPLKHRNRFTGLAFPSLRRMLQLQILQLSYNQFVDELSDLSVALPSLFLTRVNLDNNNFTARALVLDYSISPKLTEFDVSFNPGCAFGLTLLMLISEDCACTFFCFLCVCVYECLCVCVSV